MRPCADAHDSGVTVQARELLAIDFDGSIELHFAPELPAAAPASNWIQTAPGRAFICCIRFYGTEIAFYDQTWKPDDLVKVI